MTATTLDYSPTTGTRVGSKAAARPLWQVAAATTVVAGLAAEAFGAVAKAVDVPMLAKGEEIPVGGFMFSTAIWMLVGTIVAAVLIRKASHPARTFAILATTATLVSLALPATADIPDTATKVVLAASHVIVGAVAIPVITRRIAQAKS